MADSLVEDGRDTSTSSSLQHSSGGGLAESMGGAWRGGENLIGEPDRMYEVTTNSEAAVMRTVQTKQVRKSATPQKTLTSFNMCIRYILIVGNCLFFMFGCTVIGLAIYVIVDKVNVSSAVLGIRLIEPAAYLILTAGCAVFCVSFLGCMAAMLERKALLLLYAACLGLTLCLSTVGFVLAAVFRNKINERVREYMKLTLRNDYGVNLESNWNSLITAAWDSAQWKWRCCSVDDEGWNTYKSSAWFAIQPAAAEIIRPLVPVTCCARDQYNDYINLYKCQTWPSGPPTVHSPDVNSALFYRGCFEASKIALRQIFHYLIGIGVSLTVLTLVQLLLALKLACALSNTRQSMKL